MDGFEKITDDLYYSEDFNIRDHLTEKVDYTITGNVVDFEMCQHNSLLDCESPIEQLLSLEIERIGLEMIVYFNPSIDVLGITRQAEIAASGSKYRVDFLIEVHYMQPKDRLIKFVVECDGFDYHSSKEQMKSDYVRTRKLQENGYEMLKFTGTEIYNSAYKCAREILRAIVNKSELLKLNKA